MPVLKDLSPVEKEMLRVLVSHDALVSYKTFRETHFRGSNEKRIADQLRELGRQGLLKVSTNQRGMFLRITEFGKNFVEGASCN